MKNARKKTPKLVITFESSMDAMAMETMCRADMGRIIPAPRAVSAGCGLAWCAVPAQKDELVGLMLENGVRYRDIAVIEMY